ncbi:hypothetical protein ACFQ1E_05385 [Sphingomonas canadensis]|uniref:LPXTG cell wall anchor domain-containing protein n=1 Tax=Sphingomonas canadensis TaxID=1219257 RepID=A0ABW3H3I4_9SPHN
MKTSAYQPAPRLAVIFGAALVATPAMAQEVAPPPVVSTQTTPAPAPAQPRVVFAPAAPVVQEAPAATAEPAPQPARARPAQRQSARAAPARASPAAAPRAAAPAPQAQAQPAETPPPAAPAAETAPVPQAAAPVEPVETLPPPPAVETGVVEENVPQRSNWLWIALGAVLAGAIAFALLFRRRRAASEEYAPAAAAPIAAAPIAATEADAAPAGPIGAELHASRAARDELAGIADRPAPVAARPWLELGMRPVRAGTSADEALVEIELIVGNAGDTPAEDVRIAAFMLPPGTRPSEMEALLIEQGGALPPQTIRPGEGTRIDGTLAVHRSEINGSFAPLVVAEARYRLPDGSEGRTAATFQVGIDNGGGIAPIAVDRPAMHDDVSAELRGRPEHV